MSACGNITLYFLLNIIVPVIGNIQRVWFILLLLYMKCVISPKTTLSDEKISSLFEDVPYDAFYNGTEKNILHQYWHSHVFYWEKL